MEDLNKIMALDIGLKRIGVAISDPLKIIVSQSFTLQYKNIDNVKKEIMEIAKKNNVKTIIFGMPYNLDGTISDMCEFVKKFALDFENTYNIVFQDERLTSFEAEDILKNQSKKYTKKKSLVDAKAASIILSEYLINK